MARLREVSFLTAAEWPEHYPDVRLPEVAFAGRSNVGKSSLINALVGRRGLARTSQTPGKTQRIHFYKVEHHFVLVDLPGYGFAKVPESVRRRWGPMVERYLNTRSELCLVVVLLDIRRLPTEEDLQLKAWLEARGLPGRYVLTKGDKISKGRRGPQIRRIAERLEVSTDSLMVTSARTREGNKALWGVILSAVRDFGRQQPM
jgi:GTP-binding protein